MNSDRFDDVSFPSGGGIHMGLSGSAGETIAVAALQPVSEGDIEGRNAAANASSDWLVQVKQVVFTGNSATVVFGDGDYE